MATIYRATETSQFSADLSQDASDMSSNSSGDDEMFDDEEQGLDVEEEEDKDKDKTEIELERLVFGDSAGFRNELENFESFEELEDVDEVDEAGALTPRAQESDLGALQDSDLFFLDTATEDPQALLKISSEGADLELTRNGRPPAWIDSDDERMTVSLMSAPRMRKLRTFEGEDVISGKEYSRRLRRQYETLHPVPDWAKQSSTSTAGKRRRSSMSSEEDSEASDMEIDSSDERSLLKSKPLSALLRSTDALTRTSMPLTKNKRVKLNPETIPISRMRDLGPTQPHSIDTISIHPTLPLIVSAGNSSTMYLHHLHPHPTPPDPPNPLLTSLHIKHTPLTTAVFSPSATPSDPKIYLSSRRRYFHTWTLPTGQITKTTRINNEQKTTQRSFETLRPSPCGNYIALEGTTRKGGGVVNILSAATTQWIAQARIDGRKGIASFAWWSDGRGLSILSKGGEISEWSVTARRTVWRWRDEGAHGSTVIALGGRINEEVLFHGKKKKKTSHADAAPIGADRWVAIGSQSGVVNIYDRVKFLEAAGRAWTALTSSTSALATTTTAPSSPLSSKDEEDSEDDKETYTPSQPQEAQKRITSLTTPTSHLTFSRDGQLLCLASRWKRDALRLVHLPSCTVYRNWPTSKTPLGRVSAVAWGEAVLPITQNGEGSGESEEFRTILLVGNESGALRGWEVGNV